VFELTGNSLVGKRSEIAGMDEYEGREHMRKNRRRPIEETLQDIGEGRGEYLPRYNVHCSTADVYACM
jgi:hypothetical protein